MLPVTQTRLIDSPDIESYLVKQIATIFMLKGQEISEAALLMQSQLLKTELEKYFPSITAERFEKALNMGVRGEFGEYMGLNIITYNSWIKSYQVKPKYVKPSDDCNLPSDDQLKRLEHDWKLATQKQFSDFKQSERLDIVFPTTQYKEFFERGLLNVDDYRAYLESAKRHIIEEKKKKRLTSPAYKLKPLSEIINRISNGIENEDDNAIIEAQAKKEAIENYYRSISVLNL